MARASPPAAATKRFAFGLSINFGPLITHDKGVPLHSLAVSANGEQIAAGSERGDIFAWKKESAERR